MTKYFVPSHILDIVHDTNLLKVKSVVSHNSKKNFNIVSYDKDMLANELIPVYGKYRSVIMNDKGEVVSFAPPKSLHTDTFIKSYPDKQNKYVPLLNNVSLVVCVPADETNEDTKLTNIIAEEFVEGTMLNLFFSDGVWEVATKQTVGANVRFYKETADTFYSMFLDAMQHMGLTFEMFDKKNSYSFVLQHPKNRIVVPFTTPALYLIAIYHISFSLETNEYEITKKDIPQELAAHVKTPVRYDWASYTELIQKYASMNTPYECVGVMIHNVTTGERCKIRNPVYEQVRQLRGNQPKLQYQYLSLRKEGKVAEFLGYYPEHKRAFSFYRDNLHVFTQTIFQNYISCYMKKQKPLLEYPPQYRPHMYNLHKLYINELKEKQQYITKMSVIEYVNNLHPSQQMYWLNYNMSKSNAASSE